MLFDNDGAYPPLSQFFAQQLGILESGSDPATVGLAIGEVAGQGNSQLITAGNSRIPPYWIYKAEGYAIVFIGGTEDISQAATLVTAWSRRIPNDTFAGLPDLMDSTAFAIIARFQSFGPPTPGRVFFVGHSYGGVLAQAAAAVFKSRNPSVSVLSVTFGAPRTGDRRFTAMQSRDSNTRWMNDDDPVPLLPPSIPAAISYASGLGNEVIGRWEQFVHGGGGVVLDSAGNPTPGELPPFGTISGGASLAGWLVKAGEGGITAHSMSTYYDRLTMLVNRTAPPMPSRVSEARAEPSRVNDRHTQNVQIDAWVGNIVHTGAAQQQPPIVVPENRPFKKVRFQGLWWITFGDELVAVAPNKKRAGRFCVIGNDFLRRHQRLAGVDTEAMKKLYADYIDAARIPDNGFVPAIAAFPTT